MALQDVQDSVRRIQAELVVSQKRLAELQEQLAGVQEAERKAQEHFTRTTDAAAAASQRVEAAGCVTSGIVAVAGPSASVTNVSPHVK